MTNAELEAKLKMYFEEQGIGENPSEKEVVDAKSRITGVPICDVKFLKIQEKVLNLMKKEQAQKYCALPFAFDDYDASVLLCATDEPLNFDKQSDLQCITGYEVKLYYGTKTDILSKIEECYAPKENAGAAPAGAGAKAAEAGSGSKPGAATGGAANVGASGIVRYDVSEEFAHSGIIKAGDFYYLGYCVGNVGGTIEEQINGAFDHMEKRLKMVGLTLENVVQMDCLFRDVWNIPVMERVIKKRFHGKYPVRKSIQTNFAHVGGEDGLMFQVDGIAYGGR